MSRDYYHSRWNDQNWSDDGHCLRRKIPIGDVWITAHITYWPYEKRASGSIDLEVNPIFGGYWLHGRAYYPMRNSYGPGCVGEIKEHINRFIEDHIITLHHWYHKLLIDTYNRDTDHLSPEYQPDRDPADIAAAWAYIAAFGESITAMEKGPVRAKRSGQMALSAEV